MRIFSLILLLSFTVFFLSCDDDEFVELIDCEINLAIVENTCSKFTFYNVDQLDLRWQVNGEAQDTATQFTFEAFTVGTYAICGVYDKEGCEPGLLTCDTIIVDAVCLPSENACEVQLSIEENSCSDYSFSNSMEVAMDWSVNDSLVTTNETFDFMPQAAGTYEICGFFETPDCPTGGQACTILEVSSDCFATADCQVELISVEENCSVHIFRNSRQAVMEWLVNDSLVTTSESFNFTATSAGTYEICGQFETPDCPLGGTDCMTIEVSEDCFANDACEVELTRFEETCALHIFENSRGMILEWRVDGALITTAESFNFSAPEAGTYEICGFFETPDCPTGGEACMTIEVSEDCFANNACEVELTRFEETCALHIFENSRGMILEWRVDGVLITTAVSFNFSAPEAGTYEICGSFETPDCPTGGEACMTIEVSEDCFANDACEVELTRFEETCALHIFENSIGVNMDWRVNGILMTTGTNFNFSAPEAGTYEICGAFETPDCPLAGGACMTVVVAEDCFANDACEVELTRFEETCTLHIFENSRGVNMDWRIDGELTASGANFNFSAPEAGTYEICGSFETADCPTGGEACMTIEVAEDCFASNPCEVELLRAEETCALHIFENSRDLDMDWTVNGESVAAGTSFNFSAPEAGTYEICGFFETPDCPLAGGACMTIEVAEDCF